MKKIAFLFLTSVALFSLKANAQDDGDVLRYSQMQTGGTARSIALGGAMGAVGADFSNASLNPAGLGMYRSSEFTFTPSVYGGSSTANYLGNENTDSKINFGFGNLGFVARNNYTEKGKPITKGWTGFTFAFGINKLANYSNVITYSGYNRTSSIGDKYAQDLSGKNISPNNDAPYTAQPWGAGNAYETYLVDAILHDSTNYAAATKGGNVTQTMSSVTHGAANEMTLSFAGSWENKIFIGGTLGLPIVNYHRDMTYSESDDSLKHTSNYFNNFSNHETINTSGVGVNLKLGALALINDYLRVGLAVHSPTYYSLKDDATQTMTTNRYDTTFTNTTQQSIDYNITTPWRFIGSAALMFKKYGFLTFDYEITDYTSSNIHFSSTNAGDVTYAEAINKTLHNNYNSLASNFRVGAEVKFDIFALRAGYGYYASPYKTPILSSNSGSQNIFSVGAGIREHDYFFDLAIQRSFFKTVDAPYVFDGGSIPSPLATVSTNKTMVMATVGFKF